MTLETSTAKTTLSDIVGPKFSIVTKALSGGVDADGKRRFRATASSTITDLAGDEITLPALEKMAQKFRQGLTIFMDHDFKHVDSAFGLTDGAEIVQRGVDSKGAAVWDLDITGVVNAPNPRALQLSDSIDGGYVKLGASITAFVREHVRKKQGGLMISDLDVIEASIVGVPENQRSWAQKAALAIKSFHPIEDSDEEMTVTKEVKEGLEVQPGDVAQLTVAPDGTSSAEVVAKAGTPEAEAFTDAANGTPPATLAPLTSTTELSAVSAAPDACPACGQGRETTGCDNGYHAAEQSTAESTLGVQESAKETPETAPAETAETDAPELEKVASVSEDVAALVKQSAAMVVEIGRLREENAALRGEIATQKQLNQTVSSEVELAKQVIAKVMERPLQAKTAGYVEQFTASHQLFGPEIAEYLNKRGANERS